MKTLKTIRKIIIAATLTLYTLACPSPPGPEPDTENPVAVINADPLGGYVPFTVNFDGSSSYDNKTTLEDLVFNWDFENDGITDSNEISPSHAYANPMDYNAKLTVADEAGNSNSTLLKIIASIDEPLPFYNQWGLVPGGIPNGAKVEAWIDEEKYGEMKGGVISGYYDINVSSDNPNTTYVIESRYNTKGKEMVIKIMKDSVMTPTKPNGIWEANVINRLDLSW